MIRYPVWRAGRPRSECETLPENNLINEWQSEGRAGCDGRKRRGQYGEGGHAHREKTRPANPGDTVPDAGARGIVHRPEAHEA